MKFGHTLYDLIAQEWHPYSVDYKGMKRQLKGDSPVSKDRKDEFFRLFEVSKVRIHMFYSEREKSAKTKMTSLKDRVRTMKTTETFGRDDSGSTSGLAESLSSFNEQLDVLIEFLDLNKTGFSKILKKFDKRVGSSLREAKFAELMSTHMFLDAAEIFKLKEEIEQLEREILQMESGGIDRERFENDASLEVAELLSWIQSNSMFFKEHSPRTLPHFMPSEVVNGALLGQGEFGIVHEVAEFAVPESCHICFLHQGFDVVSPEPSSFLMPNMQDAQDSTSDEKRSGEQVTSGGITGSGSPEGDTHHVSPASVGVPSGVTDFDSLHSDHEDDEDVFDTRGFMKDHCMRDGAARYALKQLRDDVSAENREAAADLAMEAKFLAVLAHPNIVKMRGSGGIPGNPDFFIVLDRLYDTLSERCQKWAMHEKKAKGFFGLKKNQPILENLWVDRLVAVYDIARAMRYLHSQNVAFRDLKPENVGFDIRGDAKIFDFGLAKELLPADQVGPDQFNASGMTGTRRYMPPEVALCKPYGLSADVYSFAILLWEVLCLKTAFVGYDYEKHANKVVLKGKRPKIPSSFPALLKSLVQRAWSNDPALRPSFSSICDLLHSEISRLDQTNVSDRSADLLTKSESSMYREHLR